MPRQKQWNTFTSSREWTNTRKSTDGPNISGGRLIIEHEHVDGGIPHNEGFALSKRYRENESAGCICCYGRIMVIITS